MRISIFGLGYVGSVSSACLAGLGHEIMAVDKNALKMSQIAQGASPIVEDGVAERFEPRCDCGSSDDNGVCRRGGG